MSEEHKQLRNLIGAIIAAVVVVVIALLLFMNANNDRIVGLNGEYLETSTEQTARRVNDIFNSSLNNVRTAAAVYEQSLSSPDVDPWEATDYLDFPQFDYSFIYMPDGYAYNRDGRVAYGPDKISYIHGMEGESGTAAVRSALFAESNVVVFYAPVFYDDEVACIMVCVYRESTLTQVLTTAFLGYRTPTYLCGPNGAIVARSVPYESDDISLSTVFKDYQISGVDLNRLMLDISGSDSVGFTYRDSEGTGNAYISHMADYDWVVVRMFSPEITNMMLVNANLSGIILGGGFLLASGVLIAVLMVQSRRRNNRLLLERQKATRVIDATTNLFAALLSINLSSKTYEVYKNTDLKTDLKTTGSFKDFSDVLEKIIDTEDVVDESEMLALFHPEEIRRRLRPDVKYFQQECHTIGDDPQWYQVSILCLSRNGRGSAEQVLVGVQNITEAKRAELKSMQALEDAFRAAEHASHAKSDFLNSMSHDIRTPMNSIIGLTAIAGMHADDPERVRECLANISSASRHLLGLINEVLDMAKIESGTIGLQDEDFELSETIENVLAMIAPQIDARHQNLHVDLVNIKHEHVIGDPTRLQQVFVNIMGNSIKFTPENGDISLRITELPSRIPDNGCYEFVFSDTGVGMSKEFLETIFEPFTRVNDSRTTKVEGTGLGMSIVKNIVTMMNGTIEVASEEGVGTTFNVTIHLRLREGATEGLETLDGIRALVVDDDPIACESARILLEDIGMRPQCESSGKTALEAVVKAEEGGDPFGVILLDWRMPEMSGLEAARRIRKVTDDGIPIIILSAYDWSIIEQEAREVGVSSFISKPMFRSRTVQVLEQLLSGELKPMGDEQDMLRELNYQDKSILLTEDTPMAAMIALELLEITGASVDHAENGKEAVDALLEHEPGHYDIVFMDIQMPVMNGYEAAGAIREAAANGRDDLSAEALPIVALSADAFAEDVKRAHASGMNDHMAKPLDIETLVQMLRKWVE